MVYALLGVTLLIALYSLITLWAGTAVSLRYSWHRILAALALGSFIYLYGTWVYLTIYAKYAYGLLVLITVAAGVFKGPRGSRRPPVWKLVPNIFFTLFFSTLSVLYFTGSTGRAAKVALAFPLKTGKYFILQGGKGLPTNFFHYSYRGAIYAIDIVKLNRYGNRANAIFSSRLEDYEIFNDTIFSPCDGQIVRGRSENPDNIPPSRERGPSNTNQLLIKTDSFYVFLAHLKQNGVLVKEGDTVKTGQPLALVGNSGFTLEPHLHIQVHRNTGLDGWYREEPLYIEFDGRAYLMFEVIRPKRVDMVGK